MWNGFSGPSSEKHWQSNCKTRFWGGLGFTGFSAPFAAELTATHFGGGSGPVPGKAAQQPSGGEEPPKSRRELIEELIARSKQEKVSSFLRARAALPWDSALGRPRLFSLGGFRLY